MKFNRVLQLSYLGGMLLVALVWVVSLNSKLRVQSNFPKLEGEISYSEELIIMRFNNPLAEDGLSIALENKTRNSKDFLDYEIRGRSAIIDFGEYLVSGSDYKLTIEQATDRYGSEFRGFEREFSTRNTAITFLTKNENGKDSISLLSGIDYNDNFEEAVLFEAEDILDYDATDKYLAVASALPEDKYKIEVLERQGDVFEPLLEEEFEFEQLGSVRIAEQQKKVVFSKQKYTYEGEFFIPQTGFVLNFLDLENGKIEDLNEKLVRNNPEDYRSIVSAPTSDIITMRYDKKFGLLVYRGADGGTYLMDLEEEKNRLVGIFLQSGNISAKTQELLVLAFDPSKGYEATPYLAFADLSSNQTGLTSDQIVRDGSLFNGGSGVVYSVFYNATSTGRELFNILVDPTIGEPGDEQTIFAGSPDQANLEFIEAQNATSFELPMASSDGKYLVFEAYTGENLNNFNYVRSKGYDTKPNFAELVVFEQNAANGLFEEVNRFDGIEARFIEY